MNQITVIETNGAEAIYVEAFDMVDGVVRVDVIYPPPAISFVEIQVPGIQGPQGPPGESDLHNAKLTGLPVIYSDDPGPVGATLVAFHDSVSPDYTDVPFRLVSQGRDSLGGVQDYGEMSFHIFEIDPVYKSSGWKLHLAQTATGTVLPTLHVDQISLRHEYTDSGPNSGPDLRLIRLSSSPAASDVIGSVQFHGKDASANTRNYAEIRTVIEDTTVGSQDASLRFRTIGTTGVMAEVLALSKLNGAQINDVPLIITSTDAGATALPNLNLYRNSASPLAADLLGNILFTGKTSTAAVTTYASIDSKALVVTNAAQDGELQLKTVAAGTLTTQLTINKTSVLVGTKLMTKLSATTAAGLNLPHGAAPSAPVDGDVWTTTAGAYWRINGVTIGPIAGLPIAQSSVTDLTTDLASKANVAGQAFTGRVTVPPHSGTTASFCIGPGSGSPSALIDGDLFITTAGNFLYRANGATQFVANLGQTQTFTGAKTFSLKTTFATPTTAIASFNTPHGVAPSAPVDGDVWTTTTGIYVQINGAPVGPLGRSGIADWADITSKPATFPPTLPIPSSGITGLDAALAGMVLKAGDTMTGKLTTPPSTAAGAGFNWGQGNSPATIVDGDVWQVGATVRYRASGVTNELVNLASAQTITGIKTFSAKPIFVASTTATASINIPLGATPTTPVNGDVWFVGNQFFIKGSSATAYELATVNGTQTITGIKTFSNKTTFVASAAGQASILIPPGVTPSSPADGDIWTTSVGMYVRINGVVVGPLAASGGAVDWTVVTGKPVTFPPSLPIAQSGITNLETDLALLAPLASPGLTGVPTVPTAAPGTNTTQIASTAFAAAAATAAATGVANNAVLKAGDTMSGDLVIAKATPFLSLDKAAAGQEAGIVIKTGGVTRWSITSNTAAEAGSDAGSNLAINYHADSGTVKGTINFTRADGKFTAKNISSSGYIQSSPTSGSANIYIDRIAGQSGLINFRTVASARWQINCSNAAESGADAGSNFQIIRSSDAGTQIDTVIDLNRATGLATVKALTATGKVTVPASTTASAGLNIGASGTAPSAPVSGDIWVTATNQLWFRGGNSYEVATVNGGQTFTGAKTFGTKTTFYTSATGNASILLPHGVAPTTPINGDVWTTTLGMYVQVNGATVGPLGVGGGGVADWDLIIGKPLTFPPDPHVHPQSDIAGLVTDLAGKAATVHTHAQADITNLIADLDLKAPLASPTFTGTVTVPAGSATIPSLTVGVTGYGLYQSASTLSLTVGAAARFIMSTANITSMLPHNFQYGTAAAPGIKWQNDTDSGFWGADGLIHVAIAGVTRVSFKAGDTTFLTPIILPASVAGSISLRIPHGVEPSAPVDGDLWTTTAGLYVRVNGGIVGPLGAAADWSTITGKPATFPPTVPIAQSDITDLTTDLTARVLKAGDTMTGNLTVPLGTTALPSLNFEGNPTVGLSSSGSYVYLSTAGTARFAAGSILRAYVAMRYEYGTAAAPAMEWNSDTDTGIWGAASTINFSTSATNRVSITDTGTTFFSVVNVTAGTAALPSIAFAGVANTGIYGTTTALGFSTSGAVKFTIGATTSSFAATHTLFVAASTATRAGLSLPPGAAPSIPANGDFWTETTGFYGRVNGVTIGPLSGVTDWTAITSKPATFAPDPHVHPQSEITNLVTDLAGKAATVHTHAQADVTSLVTDLAAKAPLASPTFTGVPAAPTAAALTSTTQLATTAFVTTADNLKAPIASPTFTGKVTTAASAAGGAGFILTPGAAPTSPANGDLWSTTLGVYARINGVNVGPFGALGEPVITGGTTAQYWRGDKSWQTLDKTVVGLGNVDNTSDANAPVSTAQAAAIALKANIASPTFTGKVTTAASATGSAGFNIPPGVAPSSPAAGDIWIDAANTLFYRGSSATHTVAALAGAQSFTATKTFTVPPVMATPTTAQASVNLPHGVVPSAPANGDVWTTTTGFYARINGVTVGPFAAQASGGISDAPNDGSTYGRKNLGWVVVAGGGTVPEAPTDGTQYARLNANWTAVTYDYANLTSKPATFPPTLPIAQSGITNLTTDLGLKAPIASPTFTGKVTTAASATGGAGLSVLPGVAPSAPVDGDVFLVSTTASIRAGATTYNFAYLNGTQSFTGVKTFTAKPTMTAPTTSTASILLPHGTAPTTPVDGDMWTTTLGLYTRVNGATIGPMGPLTTSLDWGSITGKPATFTPTLPIAETDVTNLVTDLAAKAPIASPTLTGTVTAPVMRLTDVTDLSLSSTGHAFQIGPSSGLNIRMDNNEIMCVSNGAITTLSIQINGGQTQFGGRVITVASTTTEASINVPHGAAPTTPANGDLWTTTTALLGRINGVTKTFATDTDLALKANTTHTHVQADVTNLVADLALKAPLADPIFTGVPAAPTAAPATNTTQIATTAFVGAAITAVPVEPPIAMGTTAQYWRGDKTWQTNDKASVGLGNVDNTADSAKPVSTAQQTALDLKANLTGAAFSNGISFGSTTTTAQTLTRHIALYSTTYGFNVTSGTLNAVTGGKFDFYSTATLIASFALTGASITGTLSVGGILTILTAAPGTNTTQAASTAFVTAADALKANIASPTFTGKVTTAASATGGAGFSLLPGVAPTSPVNGDLWTTAAGLFVRANGVTQSYLTDAAVDATLYGRKDGAWVAAAAATHTHAQADVTNLTTDLAAKANLSGAAFTGVISVPASTTAGAYLNIGNNGVSPSAPVDGDLWYSGGFLNHRSGGATYVMVNAGNTQTISGAKTFSGACVFSGTGITVSGKIVFNASDTTRHRFNLAPSSSIPAAPTDGDLWTTTAGLFARINGVSQQCAMLASPTFTGTPSAPTAALGTNTTQLATTAYVQQELASDLAIYAPLASPALTGTPTVPTAAPGTNTTQVASTAFVVITYAPLASPALTGIPTAPTAAPATNTTQLATTAFVMAAMAGVTGGATVADTPPAGTQGKFWFDSSTGNLFVYYDDSTSAQWIQVN